MSGHGLHTPHPGSGGGTSAGNVPLDLPFQGLSDSIEKFRFIFGNFLLFREGPIPSSSLWRMRSLCGENSTSASCCLPLASGRNVSQSKEFSPISLAQCYHNLHFRRDQCDSSLLKGFPPYPGNVTINDDLNEDCTCQVGTQVCPANSFFPPPREKKVNGQARLYFLSNEVCWKVPSGDSMINMTSRNISQWLLKTRDQYYKKRYGGFEFGIKNPLARLDVKFLEESFIRLDKATNLGDTRTNFVERIFGFSFLGD